MRIPTVAGAILLASAAGPASAHGGLPGGTGFLAGLLHPVLAIEHLIFLVSIGILSGQMQAGRRSLAFAAVAVGLLGGLLVPTVADIGLAEGSLAWAARVILGLAVVGGCLAALAAGGWFIRLVPVAAGLGGLAVGLDTDAVGGAPGGTANPLVQVAGVLAGVSLIVLDTAALTVAATRMAIPIAPRVAGSWIAAIAVLLLTLSLVPARVPA